MSDKYKLLKQHLAGEDHLGHHKSHQHQHILYIPTQDYGYVDEEESDSKSSVTSWLLQITLICLALAGLIIAGSLIYNGRRSSYKTCKDSQLFVDLGYNLGLAGPNSSDTDFYNIFLQTVALKYDGTTNVKTRYQIEDECKEILLESYRIGIRDWKLASAIASDEVLLGNESSSSESESEESGEVVVLELIDNF